MSINLTPPAGGWGWGGGWFTKLAEATLGVAAVSFSVNLPVTKKNLIVYIRSKGINNNGTVALQFNGDTWSNYKTNRLLMWVQSWDSTLPYAWLTDSHTEQSFQVVHISNELWVRKQILSESVVDASAREMCSAAAYWNNNAQITDITVIAASRILTAGCTIEVYGQD